LQEDANTGEILWRDRVQVSDAFAEILQNMVFYHFSQRYKSAIEALHAMQSLGATNINNIAPTEVIAYPSSTTDSSPTIISNTNKVTVPVSAPATPQFIPTTPQSPVTTPHVTVSAPNPAFSKFQPFLWIALTAVISVSAAIATAKLTNRPPDNNPQTEVTKAATSSTIASSTTPPSPEPTETAILAPEPPPVVATTNPAIPSFGAIARSPSTQSKGYSWNYASRKAAETRALSECESSSTSGDCQVLISAKNACISLAESSNGAAGSGWSEDITVAENTAKQVCKEFQGINCTITNTICLPVR
jgi:serine/threonine-protein kinase